jgi:hypothetical protein
MPKPDLAFEPARLDGDAGWRDVEIRRTTAEDLPRVSELTEEIFGRRRSLEMLRWLLENRRDPTLIESWVVARRGLIAGHVAVLTCRYHLARAGREPQELSGAHAVLWMVQANDRGVGIPLGTKVVINDGFVIVVGGSPTTQAILRARAYRNVVTANEVRWPLAAPTTNSTNSAGDGSGLGLIEGLVPPTGALPTAEGLVTNQATPENLTWLAECPELRSWLGTLTRDGQALGPVLLLAEATGDSGRIAHLPFLGDDLEAWHQALRCCGDHLARMGCRHLSILVTDQVLAEACRRFGGETYGTRPVWIKGSREVYEADRWYLTYLEGDLGYRGLEAAAGSGARS